MVWNMSGVARRMLSSNVGGKIRVENPVVELDGNVAAMEMT